MRKAGAKILSLVGLAFLFFGRRRILSRRKTPYATQASSKSLLWEIKSNGLATPSYFLGTMHLMCAEDAILSSNVKNIVKEVEQIYFEADINNASELLAGLLTSQGEENESLQQVLMPEEYERVKNFFDKLQPSVPFELLEKQYPLMLQSSLYEFLLPCEQKNGIELRLMEEARNLKKEIKGLETLEFQAGVFNAFPYKDQAYELLNTIDNLPKYKQNLEQLIEVYKQQDLDKLYELTTSEETGIASHLELLVYSRNREWVNQFEAIAKQQSTLFAVGAGHLGGPEGVIRLLKNKGFEVRPLVN
jgi:uncharacterized protein